MSRSLLEAANPVFVLLNSRLQGNDRALLAALTFIILGVVVSRWNVTLSGLVAPRAWSPGILRNVVATRYVPSWTEIAVSTGVLGYTLLAFTLGVRYLSLFPRRQLEGTD